MGFSARRFHANAPWLAGDFDVSSDARGRREYAE
jgi:hypothetical protein